MTVPHEHPFPTGTEFDTMVRTTTEMGRRLLATDPPRDTEGVTSMHADSSRSAAIPSTPHTTKTTRVVHVNDHVPDAVYIGRAMPRQRLKASPFANPYKIGAPSYQAGGIATRDMMTRQYVIERYERDLEGPKRHLLALLPDLRGKPISCWCRHDGELLVPEQNLCHGDVLTMWLAAYTDDALQEMAVQP